jgi:hypothetical protein
MSLAGPKRLEAGVYHSRGGMTMSVTGVRREKAALFQWVQGPSGNRSGRSAHPNWVVPAAGIPLDSPALPAFLDIAR